MTDNVTALRRPAAFECGDVVALNSGGNPMTVRSVVGRAVAVDWLDDYGQLQSGEFPVGMLQEAPVESVVETAA